MKARMLTFATILISQLFLVSCASVDNPARLANNVIYRQDIATSVSDHYPPKPPERVALYKRQPPNYAYRVIGVATVDKKNLFGKTRDQATIDAMMKQLAASIGGDGIIEIVRQHDKIQASVIVHQRVFI